MNYDGTLPSLLDQRVALSGPRPALHYHAGSGWNTITWSQLGQQVARVSSNLVRHGLQAGDRVALISENRLEWIVTDLAVLRAGGVLVPIHASHAGSRIAAQIQDSGAALVVVAGQDPLDKLESARVTLPPEIRWFAFDATRGSSGRRISDWQALAAPPGEQPVSSVAAHTDAGPGDPNRLASILYTSGTLGEPRGVMLTHRNLMSNTAGILAMFRESSDDLRLNFLPFSHIFARTCDLYTWLASGCQLALARSRETLAEDLRYWQPTLLNGVPFFYERLWRRLRLSGRADEAGAVRAALGGRVRLCCSGGAALPEAVQDYYAGQEVPLMQGYGLTETSPVITLSTPRAHRRGSVGRPLPGVEVRLAEDGELWTRGQHVTPGYWNRPEATAEVLHEGWLRTGDLARQDDDGFLYIVGRKREILVTSQGRNVSPAGLEALLTQDPLIHQALVVGEGRDFLAALIVPDPETLRARIKAARILLFSRRAALRNRRVRALYERAIRERLRDVSPHEQVRRFVLLGRAFSIEQGEMTPKLSLCRKVIEGRFRREIEALYAN